MSDPREDLIREGFEASNRGDREAGRGADPLPRARGIPRQGRGSGIELSQTLTWIFTIPEGGKPNRIHLVRTREAALEAIRA